MRSILAELTVLLRTGMVMEECMSNPPPTCYEVRCGAHRGGYVGLVVEAGVQVLGNWFRRCEEATTGSEVAGSPVALSGERQGCARCMDGCTRNV